ncbi:HNH endonuclease signature motif containing protein [Spirosoma validum]|uniref:HNH endonuclease n=1 Tax=Spirosoma validum TaxID=2771355 RepID=A0A927B199_9BACT|nr:HNH endonuclease signature motif containing protein [Spirosoma validum]MBD2753726.1 HNH endonuclease [Spirosoma validum]
MKISFFSTRDNQPAAEALPVPKPVKKNQFTHYSDSQKQFIRDHFQSMTNAEIGQALGRSKASVASIASDMGLVKNVEAKFRAASIGQRNRKDAWSDADIQCLRDNYQTHSRTDLAKLLGRKWGAVKSKARQLRLIKTTEAVRAILQRPNAGQFKKGSLPKNTIISDQTVIRTRYNYKRKIATQYIRLGLGKWQELKHYVWEQANGPVPKGMILAFIDGDECQLDNLELITMAENARRNSGTINLPDSYVASLMSVRKPELKQELLKHPEIIDLKRQELKLKKSIKAHDNAKHSKTRRSSKRHGRQNVSR